MQKAHSYKYHAFTLLVAGAMSFFPLMAHAATTGTLNGTVRSSTGQPVVGAEVRIVETGETAKTDASGSYNFTGEDPGTVTLTVSSATFNSETLTTTVTQDIVQRLDFVLQRKTVRTTGTVIVPGVPRAQTSTASVITADEEQKVKSQPNNLYQFPGLLFGQPGITYDPGGYLHIRGSDLFQVGFLVDGISVIDPITNEFATNIVTVGLKSANFYTNVADPSYGGATGGFINEITYNGRDLHNQGIKGITELTVGPSSQWNYIGTNTQFGDITKDGKFDYYASTVRFRNTFPPGFGAVKLPDSQDTLFKVNYYADPNNEVSGLYGHGLENYQYPSTSDTKIEQPTYDANPGLPGYNVNQDVQSYDIGYVALRHRFNPQSFLSYRFAQLYSAVTFHLEDYLSEFRKQASTSDTNQLDYQNQLSKKFQLKAGLQYVGSHNNYHLITGSVTTPFQSLSNASGYNDRANLINTAETDAYLGGELKPNGDKLTLDLGGRYSTRGYRNIGRLTPFTDHFFDPRAGVAFSPNRDLQFHSSLTRTSQMPETRYVAYLEPGDPSGVDPFPTTANSATAQLNREKNYTPNSLRPYYSENFDLGVDKAFKLFGNSFATSLTGFTKKQYDLLTLQYSNLTGGIRSLPYQYQNTGRGQDTGAEFVFSKKAKNDYDLNGFLSYTNSVTRATSSAFDTGYIPYFAEFVTDSALTNAQYTQLDKQEFSTSYDQRHTVAAVVSKKFNHFFGTSVVLDAGSGFPFNRGTAGDGTLFANGVGAADGQHGEKTINSGGDLTEVPVLLNNGALSPLSPVVGNSGWHYKISLNSDFFVSRDTNLFLNVDNVFDKQTATVISTTNAGGTLYYAGPTAAEPQGHIYYGRGAGSVTPIFLSFGFRHKF